MAAIGHILWRSKNQRNSDDTKPAPADVGCVVFLTNKNKKFEKLYFGYVRQARLPSSDPPEASCATHTHTYTQALFVPGMVFIDTSYTAVTVSARTQHIKDFQKQKKDTSSATAA